MNDQEFAALLCSRLCHDLMSPVGALNNGLELLADENDPQMREQVIELLGDSAAATANRLKFFRLAFGAAGGFGAEIDTSEAKAALEGVFGEEKKIDLDWMVDAPKLPKDAVKLLLNLAMIAGDGLVRGGKLAVGAEQANGQIELVIRAEGPRLMIDPNIVSALTDENGSTEPRAAGAILARKLAAGQGGSIQTNSPAETMIVIGATLAG
ncbi:histidine phosphotransferase family protein [Sphingomicrobium sediminis]|uniref:Histidine phosphotransferase family protein n=1 Tax=Sphingomicrobium sediminis TaxID=2950949 RepID=A0A9X2EKB1_9SPHN|nr:histidine phosphotransferase family protein [Sphingomicrobium sediminis]MCM8556934.1 histidine phosphotransferase family protein [Sphingomicrobium sediminis]